MRKLPNFDDAFTYENNFYLTCDDSRIGKMLTHYELFKMIKNLPGDIVECGVFAGVSLVRFVSFRNLLENLNSRKIIGFDTFDKFPPTTFDQDKIHREKFLNDAPLIYFVKNFRHYTQENLYSVYVYQMNYQIPCLLCLSCF